MKHMSMIMAENASTPALEMIDLSLEGWKDAVKAPYNALKKFFKPKDKTQAQKLLDEKLKGVLDEQKRLTSMVKAISGANFNGQKIKLSTKGFNFVPSTIAEVHAGLAENNKYLQGILARIKAVKTKEEAEAISKEADAHLKPVDMKMGDVTPVLMVEKADVLKELQGTLLMSHTVEQMLRVMIALNAKAVDGKPATEGVSVEGFLDSVKEVFSFIIIIAVIAVVFWSIAALAIWALFSLYMVHPILAGVGLVGLIYGLKKMDSGSAGDDGPDGEYGEESIALEGLVEALKDPVAALRRKFPLNDKEAFSREIMLKRQVIAKERKGLIKAKSIVSSAKDSSDKKVNLSKVAKQSNFSASTPQEVLTGMISNRKMIDDARHAMEKAKTKAEAKAVIDSIDAKAGSRGKIKDEMMVSRAQALKFIDEGLLYCDSVDAFLKVADQAEGKHFSSESILGDVGSVIGGIFGFIFEVLLKVFVRLLAVALVVFIYVALMVNPWLLLYPLGGLLLIGIVSKVMEHNDNKPAAALY